MGEILAKLKDKLISESYLFIIFIVAVIIGAIITYAVYRAFGRKKRGDTKGDRLTQNVDDVIFQSTELFRTDGEEFTVKDKTLAFFNSLNYSVSCIEKKYGYKDKKKYIIVPSGEYTGKGLEISLDFTAYEMLWFLSAVLDSAQKELEILLDSSKFATAYSAYRLIKRNIDKDPKDLKISTVIEIVTRKKEEPKSKIGQFFGNVVKKITAPIVKYGLTLIMPAVEGIIDDFACGLISEATEDLNLLYSHNLSDSDANYGDRSYNGLYIYGGNEDGQEVGL